MAGVVAPNALEPIAIPSQHMSTNDRSIALGVADQQRSGLAMQNVIRGSIPRAGRCGSKVNDTDAWIDANNGTPLAIVASHSTFNDASIIWWRSR